MVEIGREFEAFRVRNDGFRLGLESDESPAVFIILEAKGASGGR